VQKKAILIPQNISSTTEYMPMVTGAPVEHAKALVSSWLRECLLSRFLSLSVCFQFLSFLLIFKIKTRSC
jgi:hypothetical protein